MPKKLDFLFLPLLPLLHSWHQNSATLFPFQTNVVSLN